MEKPSSLAKVEYMALTYFLSWQRFFSEGGKVLDIWNLFESSLQGIVYVSLFNIKVNKIVTSFLRYLYFSLAHDIIYLVKMS